MRQTVNRVLTESRKRCSEENDVSQIEHIPAKLRLPSYSQRAPAPDKHVNTLLDRLVSDHDATLLNNKKRKLNQKSNLSRDELNGLNWLREKSKQGKISVVQADKGGAILVVSPELLKKKVLEKLENPQLYSKLRGNPMNGQKKRTF